MSNDSNDICAICHDILGKDNVYTLPECNHKFHTNCIMTWFRMKHETCPLCNNKGINASKAQINEQANHGSWMSRKKYLKMYTIVSRKCRGKNASKEMKKAVEKVRAYQKKFDDFKKQRRQWNSSKPENMTVRQVISKCDKLRNRRWQMQRTLNNKKRIVGYLYGDCVTKIIIPQKVSI